MAAEPTNVSSRAHTSGAAPVEVSPLPLPQLVAGDLGSTPSYEALAAELIAVKEQLKESQRRLEAARDAYLQLEYDFEEVWN